MNISPDLLINAGKKSVRLWICSRDQTHLEVWRGEVEQAGTPYRPCKVCNGRMSIRAFKIVGENQIEEFHRRRADKVPRPIDPETGDVLEPVKKPVKVYKPKTILKRLLRKLTGYRQIGNFKNNTSGSVSLTVTRRTEILVGSATKNGGQRRCLVLTSEPDTNNVRVACCGIAGWADDVREVARKSRISISKISFQNADALDEKQYKKYLQELKGRSKKKPSRKKKGGAHVKPNKSTNPFKPQSSK